MELEEFQEFTIPGDRAVQGAFNGNFINKGRWSLNGLDELGDGGICANSLAATFDEVSSMFIYQSAVKRYRLGMIPRARRL